MTNRWLITVSFVTYLASCAFAQEPVTVLYTGKLFGYYHQELTAGQRACLEKHVNGTVIDCTSNDSRVAAVNSDTPSFVAHFLGDFDVAQHKIDPASSVLVGMGDNFAPELE